MKLAQNISVSPEAMTLIDLNLNLTIVYSLRELPFARACDPACRFCDAYHTF